MWESHDYVFDSLTCLAWPYSGIWVGSSSMVVTTELSFNLCTGCPKNWTVVQLCEDLILLRVIVSNPQKQTGDRLHCERHMYGRTTDHSSRGQACHCALVNDRTRRGGRSSAASRSYKDMLWNKTNLTPVDDILTLPTAVPFLKDIRRAHNQTGGHTVRFDVVASQ